MRLIKDQFVRFFAFGFAGGALLVVATTGHGVAGARSPTLVPAAHAAAVR
jgi:hypothetical protein